MKYGDSLYGVLGFAQDAESTGPEVVNVPDLLKQLPDYYAGSRVMKAIQDTDAEELGQLDYSLRDTLAQLFVGTATWGLAAWEDELGLTTDATKPIERRREQVLAKLRGRGTTTAAMIVAAAAAFSGGEARVNEYPAEHRFEVQFVGVKGIPANMAGFLAMLEEIKPAHLAYSIKYTYTLWNSLSAWQWGAAATKTWNELKVYEGA